MDARSKQHPNTTNDFVVLTENRPCFVQERGLPHAHPNHNIMYHVIRTPSRTPCDIFTNPPKNLDYRNRIRETEREETPLKYLSGTHQPCEWNIFYLSYEAPIGEIRYQTNGGREMFNVCELWLHRQRGLHYRKEHMQTMPTDRCAYDAYWCRREIYTPLDTGSRGEKLS